MPEAELQKSNSASQGAGEVKQPQQPAQSKDVSQLLSAFGGFNAIRGFMPDADCAQGCKSRILVRQTF